MRTTSWVQQTLNSKRDLNPRQIQNSNDRNSKRVLIVDRLGLGSKFGLSSWVRCSARLPPRFKAIPKDRTKCLEHLYFENWNLFSLRPVGPTARRELRVRV